MKLDVRTVAGDRYMAFVVRGDGHERACNHRHKHHDRAYDCGRALRNRLTRDAGLAT